jgi:hypothetical protein
MSGDWLDTVEDEDWLGEMAPEQVREVVTAAVFDDVSTRQVNAKPPAGMPALEGRLVAAMRALKPVQRTYLRAYIQAGCNRSAATRALNKRGIGLPDSSAVTRWFGRPDFKLALDLMKKLYLDTAGLDPDSVMIKAGRVHDEAMTPQPIRDAVAGETVQDFLRRRKLQPLSPAAGSGTQYRLNGAAIGAGVAQGECRRLAVQHAIAEMLDLQTEMIGRQHLLLAAPAIVGRP